MKNTLVFVGAALAALTSQAHAFKVGIDMNTYKQSFGTSPVDLRKFSGDFMYAISVNSDLTDDQWKQVWGSVGGNKWFVNEDNPNKADSYNYFKRVFGTINDSMSYNETETPSRPPVTLLTDAQIASQSASHGGKVICLTREYSTRNGDKWPIATDRCLNDARVSGIILETDDTYENRKAVELVRAVLAKGKRMYFLLPGYNTQFTTDSINYLKSRLGSTMDSDQIHVIIYDYSSGKSDWFGGWNTQQTTMNAALGLAHNAPLSGHTYQIVNENAGKAMDNPGDSTASGTAMKLDDIDYGSSQSWVAQQAGAYWTFRNLVSNKLLSLNSGANGSGQAVRQFTNTDYPYHQWSVVPTGSGSYTLQNRGSGLMLDVQGGSSASGTLIVQNGGSSQRSQHWFVKDLNDY